MDLAQLSDIQAVELEILILCKEICEMYDIPYFLAFGTLLGAVRHKGFIPWDDDADVCIPADKMAYFKECFEKEAPEGFFLSTPETEKLCPNPWFKVRKDGTTSMPKCYSDIPLHWGICIDIIPIWGVRDSAGIEKRLASKYHRACSVLATSLPVTGPDGNLLKRLASLLPPSFRKFLAKKYMASIASYAGTDLVFDGWDTVPYNDYFGKETFLEFEHLSFRVPTNYDHVLTVTYGDYMTPPPEEERLGHEGESGEIIWDTKRSYTEFKNKND